MSQSMPVDPPRPSSEAWAWWEGRRLHFNLALGAAGWAAYGLNAGLFYAFGRPIWADVRGAAGMTLLLGAGFLVLMGIANICYLAGVLTESLAAPADPVAFRRRAFALGFWGSLGVPFIFPLANFALLIAQG